MSDNRQEKQRALTKLILSIVAAVLLILGLFFWGYFDWVNDGRIPLSLPIVGLIIITLAIGSVWYVTQGFRGVKRGLPFEDERSKRVIQKAAANAFYISLYWLLALSWISDDVIEFRDSRPSIGGRNYWNGRYFRA